MGIRGLEKFIKSNNMAQKVHIRVEIAKIGGTFSIFSKCRIAGITSVMEWISFVNAKPVFINSAGSANLHNKCNVLS